MLLGIDGGDGERGAILFRHKTGDCWRQTRPKSEGWLSGCLPVMAVLNVAAEDIWGNDSPRLGRALGQDDRQAFSQMNGNNGW